MAGMLRGESTKETSQRPGDCQGSFPLSAADGLFKKVWGCSKKCDGDGKKHHNGISRVVIYILLLRLVLVTKRKSRSS